VQVEAVRPGNQRQRLGSVAAKLVGRARLAGIVPRGGQTAADLARPCLEPPDVVSLPAVDRDRNRGKHLQRRIRVDAEIRVLLFRQVVSRRDPCIRHVSLSS
jgi:hypothetical protein